MSQSHRNIRQTLHSKGSSKHEHAINEKSKQAESVKSTEHGSDSSGRADTTPIGIRFIGEHTGRGMDILLGGGSAYAFPDDVYITSREQVELVLPELRVAGVEFLLNDQLAGARLTREEKRHLVEQEGWYTPNDIPSAESPESPSK